MVLTRNPFTQKQIRNFAVLGIIIVAAGYVTMKVQNSSASQREKVLVSSPTPAPEVEISTEPSPTTTPVIQPTRSQKITPAVKKPTSQATGETVLFVTAVKENNEPVENAHIILRNAGDLSFVAEGYTDRYGNYGFGKLIPGSYRIEGGIGTDLSFRKTVTATQGETTAVTLELLYQTGGKITGTVAFADGNPIGGAKLRASKGGLCPGFGGGDVETDSNGHYELPVAAPGEYCIVVSQMNWSGVNTSDSEQFTKRVSVDPNASVGANFSIPRK